MDMDEYQQFCMGRAGKYDARDRLLLGAIALGEEAGEYAGVLKKHLFHQHPLDREKAIKELGDVFWYLGFAADSLGLKLSEIAEANRQKLIARYPNGFTPADSLARKDGG